MAAIVVRRIVGILIGYLRRNNCHRAAFAIIEIACWINREGGRTTTDGAWMRSAACALDCVPIPTHINRFAESDADIGIDRHVGSQIGWGGSGDRRCSFNGLRCEREIVHPQTVIILRDVAVFPVNPERSTIGNVQACERRIDRNPVARSIAV